MNKVVSTIFGTARLERDGYYGIESHKEGNKGQRLHRLIARNYFGDWIDDPEDYFEIHHVDGNKTNNCVLNLLPLKKEDHMAIHLKGNQRRKGIPHTDETKEKISKAQKGKINSMETKIKMSSHQNTTGYFRVGKRKSKLVKTGYRYFYTYYENGKRKAITSVNLEKLKEKVRQKGLEWFKLQGDEK